ncbi:coproporphyrinogen III oxidase [Alphaproteobacteria bacterium GH1-50]|uniref:Heme chaperone HemW n=1 Tax=Kangsaoukella pontilimi TaxID=2691042 RepID=A0A7C9MAT1_9RHOB|nr:radical SAM family heme chaperone HemW [Kangsaoukella pontilimi]MXQ08253.1 coproporphyrinogen III oxidase [Kangsaoukella pontilimi]
MTDPRHVALYVHWPFCQAKCPYCDFNSHVVAGVDHSRWRNALVAELDRVASDVPDRILTSIFFGGGTPSLMQPQTVRAIIDAARTRWSVANDVEITLEANPTSVEADKFRAFRDAGVNRVSVGLQALNDTDLRALGRLHSADEGIRAFETARDVFARTSFDLIYARQHQTREAWEQELRRAIGFGPDHMSLYQLTIEPGTAFGDRFDRGRLKGLPDEDIAADMYELTQSITASAGLPAYEVSNHARPGAESLHNLTYWRAGDWVGIGPGAHGRFTRHGTRLATETFLAPGAWITAVESGNGENNRQSVSPDDIQAERLMMGLRLTEGVPVEDIAPDFLSRVHEINELMESPALDVSNGRLRVTSSGRPVLNAVLRELLV